MIRPLRCIVIPALVWSAGSAREAPLPVVMVADVAGGVSRGGGQPLALAEGIPAQRELRLEPGGRLVVIHLKSGEELVFTGPAVVRFDTEGRPVGAKPTGRRQVANVQGGFRLEPGAWAQASVVMRKEFMPGGPALDSEEPLPFDPEPAAEASGVWLQPRGAAVLAGRLELRWHLPLPGAVARLRLTDSAGAKVFEGSVQGEALSFDGNETLRPGASYRWRLSWALPDGRTQDAEGGFTVLPEKEARLIQGLRPGKDASFSERLAFAVALEGRGLLDEARPYWLQLAAERPGDATLRRLVDR